MGKAAAPSRSGGCGGRSRGLSSLLTVVPCLSCHTAAPGMSAPTPGSEPEPQPQPVPAPEPASLAEQAWEPVSERALKMSERSERMSEPGPATGQGLELSLKVRPRSESSPCGAAPATPSRASWEQLAPAVGSAPGPKTESGLVPAIKPLPLLRPGQAKAPLGVPATGTGPSASIPMGSLTLDSFKGWLLKWTNYLKGYQRRWFVLGNGLLSYYRNQGEMAHTCRGTINLATAHVDTENSRGILLISGARSYHLKASSEVDRQQWITALELAKAKAIRVMKIHSGSCGECNR